MTATTETEVDLKRAVKRTGIMRQGFYVVVLLVALAGQVSGAMEALDVALVVALPAVAALELGGIVVMANADVRRRLGERATASRILSAAIAAGAVAFNWLAHADHLLGGFFAGMSALGYLVWLMHTENSRRDRLRAKGDLPPTTPAYELVGHWLRHPWLTRRARSLAKARNLDLYASLTAAAAELAEERQTRAMSRILRRLMRASAPSRDHAALAVAAYPLADIARRVAGQADLDGLAARVAADLTPAAVVDTARPIEAAAPAAIEGPVLTLAEVMPAPVDIESCPDFVPPSGWVMSDGRPALPLLPAADVPDNTVDKNLAADNERLRAEVEKLSTEMSSITAAQAVPRQRFTTDEARMFARALATAHPDMTEDKIAALVGRSAKQVTRYLSDPPAVRTPEDVPALSGA